MEHNRMFMEIFVWFSAQLKDLKTLIEPMIQCCLNFYLQEDFPPSKRISLS